MQVIHKNKQFFGRFSCSEYISRNRKIRLIGTSSVILLGLLSFSIIFPIQIKWTNVEADTPTIPLGTTTLSLAFLGSTVALDLTPTSSAGTFAASSPANFTVSTDNAAGYTVSIKSNVSDTSNATEVANASRLVNTNDGTKYISSISGSVAPSTFSNISNTQYNNMWGYLPSKLNSADNTNYLAAPDYTTPTVLNSTECANGTLNSSCTSASDSYSITLGARVDSNLPTGTYEHAFTIIAISNPINYSITYYANDGDNGANTTNMPTPNPMLGNADDNVTSIALSSSKPSRTGYEFKGWCTVQPTADPNYPTTDQDCTGAGGTLYQPGASITIDPSTVNIIELYATWWYPNLIKLDGHTMQEMTPLACYNSTAYSKVNGDPNHTPYDAETNPNGYHSATLSDYRGKDTTGENPESPNYYTVVKMPDGACWMTDQSWKLRSITTHL